MALTERGNFPRPLTSFVGRDADIAAARALLVDGGVCLLTLIGPGGVGKTRLAIRLGEDVAAAFPDGVVFVPLADIADPDLVLPAIARALGLREVAGQPLADLVADFLRDQRLLLVLDNVEQVQLAATQLAALLAACPGLSTLVTSRAPLHIAGEQRFPVTPLALPTSAANAESADDPPLPTIAASAAVQLFVARAQAVAPRFVLDAGNAAAVSAVCRRLDGLPLAIELAAARMRLLSPPELLARLDPVLPLLTDGPEDAPYRLRTMRQAIAWSYDLLNDEERALFRRLAVFVGGFTLEAAEDVGGERGERDEGTTARPPVPPSSPLPSPSPPSTIDLLASLIDASLLRRSEEGGETRFGMLETIREFGLERLDASGEMAVIAARHAAWCLHLAERMRRSGQVSQGRGLATLEAEHPNLRSALEWLLARGEATTALHLVGELAEFWMRHAHWAEGEQWLERALAADHGEPTAARAEALVGLNMLLWVRNEFARADELLTEAEAVARAAGDAGALAYARLHQGYIALFRGDLDLAVARGEESLTAAESIPQEFSRNGALWLLARAALARGEDDRATELHERLLASARAGGDEISLANGHYGLAVLAERRGEADRALAAFAEAATVCRGFGDRSYATTCLDGAAAAAVALGRLEPAVRFFAVVDAVWMATGVAGFQHHSHEQALAAARAALGAERFAAVWAAGAALSLDEAIAEATALASLAASPDPDRLTGAARLTSRERDVLRLLAAGLSDRDIAAALFVTRRSASKYVSAVLAKLDVPSRTAAAAIAHRDRLV